MHFKIPSAIFFNLDRSKILSSGNELSTDSPLPDMPNLDSSSSTANKDMISKMWTNGDTDV